MITMRGGHFARKLLEHEHAAEFARHPRCGSCQGTSVDLRRRRNGEWYWRCYSKTCPQRTGGSRQSWTIPALANAGVPPQRVREPGNAGRTTADPATPRPHMDGSHDGRPCQPIIHFDVRRMQDRAS